MALLAGALHASAAATPRDHAARVAPYIDPQTVVIVYADLARLDIDAAASLAAEVSGIPNEAVGQALAAPEAWASSLVGAGGGEVYWILSMDDLGVQEGLGAFVLAVVDPDGDPELVGRLLEYGTPEDPASPNPRPWQEFFGTGDVRLIQPGLVFCGHLPTYERIAAGPASARPELVEAFAQGGDTPLQLLVLPTDTHRRVIEEMMPSLPTVVGGGPSTILTRGMLFLSVAVGLPPETSVRIVAQAADKAAAEALYDMVKVTLEGVAAHLQDSRDCLDVAAAMQTLHPRTEGNRFILGLDSEAIRTALSALLAPQGAPKPPGDDGRDG